MSRRDRPEGPSGLVVVDKEAGWTSHDVVAKARGILGTRKVGHSGTLDPDATGVLLLGVGRATRLLRFTSTLPKSYTGEVVLGTETTTLDAAGDVVATHDMSHVTLDEVRRAATAFVGDITQVPPMVSAVQVGGRRLHDLAREGIEVEREPRPVTVHRFDVGEEVAPGVVAIEVDCSSGTYVRSLAADLGTALGGGAHLRNLRRTAIGPHEVGGASRLEEPVLLPMSATVAHLPSVTAGPELAALVATGTRLARDGEVAFEGEGPWAVVDVGTGELLAVYEAKGDRAKPAVVLVQPHEVGGR
ncbi:MAG TPA: tRNA pseudouridine(55) synthase TruB [Acidimicrobiales bacterium]|nr:tRNA pseudouridine(55) synthase TruB [Acidimicrobiales bacterium]